MGDTVEGFVLISTTPSKEHEVYCELLKIKEITEVHPLFGEYDLVGKIVADDFDIAVRRCVNEV